MYQIWQLGFVCYNTFQVNVWKVLARVILGKNQVHFTYKFPAFMLWYYLFLEMRQNQNGFLVLVKFVETCLIKMDKICWSESAFCELPGVTISYIYSMKLWHIVWPKNITLELLAEAQKPTSMQLMESIRFETCMDRPDNFVNCFLKFYKFQLHQLQHISNSIVI